MQHIDPKRLRRPTLMQSRVWDRICDKSKVKAIAALSTENIVFDVDTHESPSVSYIRLMYGTSSESPRVNHRRKWSTAELQLLSNTNKDATFVHQCIRCRGQLGKMLQHPTYLIRIGKYNVPQCMLNVIRFNMFYNRRTITSAAAPNTVAAGVFHKQLDRKALLTDSRSNDTTEFPGITMRLTSGAKCTPGVHTNNPSRFIMPGCRSIYDLYAAAVELSEIAEKYTLETPKNGGTATRKKRARR
jgi:hypothetical protein